MEVIVKLKYGNYLILNNYIFIINSIILTYFKINHILEFSKLFVFLEILFDNKYKIKNRK